MRFLDKNRGVIRFRQFFGSFSAENGTDTAVKWQWFKSNKSLKLAKKMVSVNGDKVSVVLGQFLDKTWIKIELNTSPKLHQNFRVLHKEHLKKE
ncbi:hypothetical protein KKA69_04785 [Patescibacteria group bacterium]|nr:hypothetical protein [Patescibacteria group bacterium]